MLYLALFWAILMISLGSFLLGREYEKRKQKNSVQEKQTVQPGSLTDAVIHKTEDNTAKTKLDVRVPIFPAEPEKPTPTENEASAKPAEKEKPAEPSASVSAPPMRTRTKKKVVSVSAPALPMLERPAFVDTEDPADNASSGSKETPPALATTKPPENNEAKPAKKSSGKKARK